VPPDFFLIEAWLVMHGSLEKVKEALGFPLYMYLETKTGYTCDKLTTSEGKVLRKRYFIAGDTQCTCMNWMKHKHCKHLDFLLEEGDAFKGGAERTEVLAELHRIISLLGDQFPDEVESWLSQEFPEIVAAVVLPLKDTTTKKVARLAITRQLKSGRIHLIFKTEETDDGGEETLHSGV